MNKRIKELAEQAGHRPLPGFAFANSLEETYLKKFAELMVHEFEKVAKQQPWYYDAPSCGWRNPIDHVCNEIKQHFGVEE